MPDSDLLCPDSSQESKRGKKQRSLVVGRLAPARRGLNGGEVLAGPQSPFSEWFSVFFSPTTGTENHNQP